MLELTEAERAAVSIAIMEAIWKRQDLIDHDEVLTTEYSRTIRDLQAAKRKLDQLGREHLDRIKEREVQAVLRLQGEAS